MSVEVSLATRDDIPALAEISRLSLMNELTARISYPNWPDKEGMLRSYVWRATTRFDYPGGKVFKACDATTGEIVGWVAFALEDVVEARSLTEKRWPSFTGTARNAEFEKEYGACMKALKERMAVAEKHYYLSALAVDPEHQGKGIGKLLMQYCIDIADGARLPLWLIAFPASHGMYLKYAFEDVETYDLDLNKYDGYRYRGFGVYRIYLMRRPLPS